MVKVIPTITAMSADEYAFQMKRLSFAERIHIDITDGDFAPSKTVNLNQIYWDRDEILKQIDLHLMIRRPIEWLHQIISLSPDLVVLHAESDNANEDLPRIAEYLRKFEIKFGIAVLPETAIESVCDLVKIPDHVLIFGGKLGFQGGTADLSQLEKAAQVREINPQAEVAWDGGADIDNVHTIANAGINAINFGSAIMKNDNPEEYYRKLTKIVG